MLQLYLWYLLTVLQLYSGEECQMSHYTISTVCNTPYGTVLSNYADVRSAIDCVNKCAYNITCMSAVYDNTTGLCTANSAALQNPSEPDASCLEPVYYAASETLSVLCGSGTQGAIYSSCVNDGHCTPVSDAECRHGKCQCVPGLSYDPVMNACVPVCFAGYGTTFSEDIGYYLDGFNDKVIEHVYDPTLCIDYCVAEPTFTCRSAELDRVWGVCFLSGDTVSSQPMAHNPDSNYTLYQRDCAAGLS